MFLKDNEINLDMLKNVFQVTWGLGESSSAIASMSLLLLTQIVSCLHLLMVAEGWDLSTPTERPTGVGECDLIVELLSRYLLSIYFV